MYDGVYHIFPLNICVAANSTFMYENWNKHIIKLRKVTYWIKNKKRKEKKRNDWNVNKYCHENRIILAKRKIVETVPIQFCGIKMYGKTLDSWSLAEIEVKKYGMKSRRTSTKKVSSIGINL